MAASLIYILAAAAAAACSTQVPKDTTYLIPGKDGGPGDNLGKTDNGTEAGVSDTVPAQDAYIGTDSGAADLPSDVIPNPDASTTPIDIPPQPKLCTSQVATPAQDSIAGLTAGEAATCAVMKDGSVKCWGKIYTFVGGYPANLFSATTPKALDGFKDIAQASMYLQHICARDKFGNVWCMGENAQGQLGNGTQQTTSKVAVLAKGASNIMQVMTGGFHSCAVDTAGTVYCWGYHLKGQLGLGDKAAAIVTAAQKVEFPQPAATYTLGAGSFHTCGIQEAGATFCWGHNGAGQLGLKGAGDKVFSPGFIDESGYRMAGGDDFSLIINKDCNVLSAGSGGLGQLGLGNTDSQLTFTVVKSLKDIALIAASRQHACAATISGALYCWGRIAKLVGYGDEQVLFSSSSPVLMNGIGPVVRLAVGANHACAEDTTATVYCWGDNAAGQLGDGVTASSTTPIKVIGL